MIWLYSYSVITEVFYSVNIEERDLEDQENEGMKRTKKEWQQVKGHYGF